MSTLVKSEFFAYQWHVIEEDEIDSQTLLRVYGLSRENKNVCVRIQNFTPYCFIELPEYTSTTPPMKIEWNSIKAQMLGNKLDELCRDKPILDKKLMYKKKLYYANLDEKYQEKLYPYLMCTFSNTFHRQNMRNRVSRLQYVNGIGRIKLKCHEYKATPSLQITSLRDVAPAGWISFTGKKVLNKQTDCDEEYIVPWKNLNHMNDDSVARPLIMGLDIEVNSSNPNAFPNFEKPGDKTFQISAVFSRQGSKVIDERILLTLGQVNEEILNEEKISTRCFDTEHDLLVGLATLIKEKNPNIIVGYNIFGFDISYLIKRSEHCLCSREFARMGFDKNGIAKKVDINWSSSAYKNQHFECLEAEGRLFVDLLPLVKRDYKLANYRLKTIAEHILKNQTKDPLDAKGIFKCYRLGMKGGDKGKKALSIVGKYCVKDSELVVKLFEVTTTWVGLCEMSKVVNVPIFDLFTRGQQLKIFSATNKKCTQENRVEEEEGYITKDDDYYVGATVFPPKPGFYKNVVSKDFTSLYPSVIIAYNISWNTLVEDQKIPDDMCHVMEWEDHVGCDHDPKVIRRKQLDTIIKKYDAETKEIRLERDKKENKHRKEEFMQKIAEKKNECKVYRDERAGITKSKGKHVICAKRRYRWLKKPMGVLPEILNGLLTARDAAKKLKKKYEKQLEELKEGTEEYDRISTLVDVMDKRQLALKISANSMYGGMGVRKGYLPFMPGAMCTTYKGRLAVELAAETIKRDYKGDLVYGDSVTSDTPIIIRHSSGKTEIRRIDDLVQDWKPYPGFKYEDNTLLNKEQSNCDFSVWSGDEWCKIKRVIRHKTSKRIFRVLTHSGCIDVTEDHSLLTKDRKKIKPEDISDNTELWHSFPFSKSNHTENKVFVCNTKIEAQNIYMLSVLRGLSPSIYLKKGKFCISLKKYRETNKIKVIPLGTFDDYVYDLETEAGVFHAGIGELIVKNTDSNYVTFPHISDLNELWNYAKYVADEISKLFPRPMAIAFEDVIYVKYFIITKKRYMSINWKDGKLSDKISKKGVLLTRRDNCNLVRNIYTTAIMGIFNQEPLSDLLYKLIQNLNNMCGRMYSIEDFIITKAVGDVGNLSPKQSEEEKNGKKKLVYKVGDYAIQERDILNESNRSALYRKKGHYGVCKCDYPNHETINGNEICISCQKFYELCLPAQVQLALQMKRRGQPVAPGTRLEYVITTKGGANGKQAEKIVEDTYFRRHSNVLELDYLYYLKQMTKPIDQILNIAFTGKSGYTKDFMLEQYKFRLKVREKMMDELRSLFATKMRITL